VRGAIQGGVGDVDNVLVLRINFHLGEIAAAAPQALLAVDASPTFAGVVGAIDAAEPGRIDQGIKALRIVRRRADADPAQPLFRGRQALGKLPPGRAAIRRFVEPAAWALPRPVLPRALPGGPEI